MPDIETVSPLAAIAAGGDTPRPSETLAQRAAAPAAATAPGMLDDQGVAFDRAQHQVDLMGNPKRTAKGTWAKKPGNGARKLQGKSIAGNLTKGAMRSPIVDQVVDDAEAAPAPGGFNAPPSTPGESGTVDAVPAPIALTPEECRPTAEAIINAAVGVARMGRDRDHWEPTTEERTQLVESLARAWSSVNLPLLPAVFDFAVRLFSFMFRAEKRRADLKQLWGYLINRKPVSIDEAGK